MGAAVPRAPVCHTTLVERPIWVVTGDRESRRPQGRRQSVSLDSLGLFPLQTTANLPVFPDKLGPGVSRQGRGPPSPPWLISRDGRGAKRAPFWKPPLQRREQPQDGSPDKRLGKEREAPGKAKESGWCTPPPPSGDSSQSRPSRTGATPSPAALGSPHVPRGWGSLTCPSWSCPLPSLVSAHVLCGMPSQQRVQSQRKHL